MLGIDGNNPDGSPIYAGPTLSLWEQLKTEYITELAGMSYIGTLAAAAHGTVEGKIDWVKSIDGVSTADIDARIQAKVEGRDVTTKQLVKLPRDLANGNEFVNQLMRDPQLHKEINEGDGGADLASAVLRAAVRMSKEER